jgi:hypothetical protein
MAHPFSALATKIYNEVLRQANVEQAPWSAWCCCSKTMARQPGAEM